LKPGSFFGSGKIAFPDEEKQNPLQEIAVLQSDGIMSGRIKRCQFFIYQRIF